jgi:ribosomal protein S18 acetylase RimI-like enzyme
LKSDDGISIRLASAEDAKEIHSLVVDLAGSMGELDRVSSTVENFRDALSGGDPAIHTFLVERNSKPVGMAIFFLTFSTWRGNRGVYLQDIYLHPDARGTGTGKKLLAKVVAWAVDRGVDHLRLSVDSGNRSAQAFYESIGMMNCSEELTYQISDRNFSDLGAGS